MSLWVKYRTCFIIIYIACVSIYNNTHHISFRVIALFPPTSKIMNLITFYSCMKQCQATYIKKKMGFSFQTIFVFPFHHTCISFQIDFWLFIFLSYVDKIIIRHFHKIILNTNITLWVAFTIILLSLPQAYYEYFIKNKNK